MAVIVCDQAHRVFKQQAKWKKLPGLCPTARLATALRFCALLHESQVTTGSERCLGLLLAGCTPKCIQIGHELWSISTSNLLHHLLSLRCARSVPSLVVHKLSLERVQHPSASSSSELRPRTVK
eukprot:3038555-Amphidinium_carterae.1